MCGLWKPNQNITYFFSGFPTVKHDWVEKYYSGEPNSEIVFTTKGRNVREQTGLYDYAYYDKLMNARIALAPDGDFVQTYRFLEAIMCRAIPVLRREDTESEAEQEIGY
jgi:hypothetical protein